ncbi:MAG: DUF3500 domain-containing protein [Chloroflexota bacterium]
MVKRNFILFLLVLLIAGCASGNIDEAVDEAASQPEETAVPIADEPINSTAVEEASAEHEDNPPNAPDFSAAAEALGIGEEDLLRALGEPPPDLEAAAETLGISVEDLQNALGTPLGDGGPPDEENLDNVEETAIVTQSTCSIEGIEAQSDDANVEAMRQAIVAFRSSLPDSLLAEGSVCLDDERFYLWHNTPNDRDNRGGIQYRDLTDEQLSLFKNLLELFLSDTGYQKVDEITTLAEGFLSEIDANVWATDFYAIDMFGDPENTGSWGFQLDGHHMAINFLVHGNAVSIVPAFIGAEPVFGTYDDVEFDVFLAERDLAFTLYNNLTADENARATSTGEDTAMVVGPADRPGDLDPYIGDYDYSGFEVGLNYSDMSGASKANLIALMQAYVYHLETPFADLWWEDVMSQIDNTYFVWIDEESGELSNLSIYYYRIYNPHLWIEYNVENSIGQTIEQGNHAHSITRIPLNSSVGDYGIFASLINHGGPSTLFEHYVMEDHHAVSHMLFDYEIATLVDHHH